MKQLRAALKVGGHPLVLLLVGAALTGYLLPSLTRQWQNHSAEVDIKRRLVRDVNEAVTSYYGSIQLIAFGGGDPTLRSLDRAYVHFNVRSSAIRGELQAYFPDDETLVSKWENFGLAMTGVYYVLRNETPRARRSLLAQYREWIGRDGFDYKSLTSVSLRHVSAKQIAGYNFDLGVLFNSTLRGQQERILDMILAAEADL